MKGRKPLMVILSVFLMLSMILGSCAKKPATTKQTPSTEKADPFGKYDPPIDLTSCRILTSWMTLDSPDDENNNVWSRAYKDYLGINLKQSWTAPNWGDPFDQKINIAIASDSLPDILPVYTTLFYRIEQGGKAADLTDLLDKYGSDNLKKILQTNNGMGIKSASLNGKLYGLAQVPDTSPRTMLYIRKDWLDKLGLQAPKTLDDLFETARQFVKRDASGTGKTIGLEMGKDFFGGDADPASIFAAYHVYVNNWVLKDGKLVRGETLPENKQVLQKLADLYKEGVIPKDFYLKDETKDTLADMVAGKVGIGFGSGDFLSTPELEDLHKKDPNAKWIVMPMPTIDGQPFMDYRDTRIANFWAVSAKCEHPEALIKMANLQVEIDNYNPKYVKDNTFNMSPTGKMNFWCKATGIVDPLKTTNTFNAVKEAMKSKDASKLNPSDKETYNKATSADPKVGDWGYAQSWAENGPNDLQFGELSKNVILSPAWGPETPAWVQNGQAMYSKVREYFTKAVTSGNVDQEFNNWLNYWNTQGGKDATDEINDWYAKNK